MPCPQPNAVRSLAFVLITALLLAACGPRQPSGTPTPGPLSDLQRTYAAQTIIAQLTKVSLPTVDPTLLALTPSPPPGTAALPTVPGPLPATNAEAATATEAAPTEGAPPTEPAASVTPEAETLAADTATPAPTSTPPQAPTATTIAGDPASGLGEPDWSDDFSTGENWALYTDAFASFYVDDGALQMISMATGARNSWMLAVPSPENYYLEVTATPGECTGLDRYGIIFRTDATTGYLFGFSCSGQYSLRTWDGQRATVLVDWTSSPYIQGGPNAANRLGLRVFRTDISLYANGGLLAELTDESLAETGFGLFVGAEQTQGFRVQVERVAYWELP